MRRGSPPAKNSVHPENLWDLPLFISRQSMIESGLSSGTRKAHRVLNIAATYNLLFNAALMVEAGMGCALSGQTGKHHGYQRPLFRPMAGSMGADMDIAWKNTRCSQKCPKILERLQESFAES